MAKPMHFVLKENFELPGYTDTKLGFLQIAMN